MIEELIQNFLSGRLSVPVRLTVSHTGPRAIVVLEKTGCRLRGWACMATLAVQS